MVVTYSKYNVRAIRRTNYFIQWRASTIFPLSRDSARNVFSTRSAWNGKYTGGAQSSSYVVFYYLSGLRSRRRSTSRPLLLFLLTVKLVFFLALGNRIYNNVRYIMLYMYKLEIWSLKAVGILSSRLDRSNHPSTAFVVVVVVLFYRYSVRVT